MQFLALLFVLLPAVSPYAPLTAYNGTWSVMAAHPFSGAPGVADKLENKCTLTADAYTCEQTVNGVHAATVIFTAVAGEPHTFLVANVLPTGQKFSNTKLHVDGARWTYQSTPSADAHAARYKTENIFADPDHIHFVQSQSTDGGATWAETNSGDETRQ